MFTEPKGALMSMKRPSLINPILIASVFLSVLGANAASSLWKVSSNKGTLYIQGSSHILKPEHYPLAPAIEAAYSNSTALILEVDMKDMLSPKTQQLIMGKAMLEPPQSLQDILSPATYENLEKACKEIGLPMQAIQQFKPWFATTTLMLVKMQKMGFDSNNGLDKYFYDKAATDSKKVIGLETLTMQIDLFDSLSDTDPDAFVNRSLKEIKLLEPQVNDLITAWKTGDMVTIEQLMKESFNEYPDLYRTFVTDRNKDWAGKLSNMIKKGETYMVVVGAGHLPGEQGLIKLMENKGFAVEQL
jgi:uncharacterized protein YbaP (TraB family)